MSRFYIYIKNQYLLGNFNDEDLITLVSLSRITEDERQELVAMK